MHSEGSIPARFEHVAARFPDSVAVRTRHAALTYQELNRAANRVARSIVEAVGTDPQPIALLTGHDHGAIVAILGALKAGMFYVPLNPRDPVGRNRYLLQDMQAPMVVTDSQHAAAARELTRDSGQVLNIQAIGSGISTEDTGRSCAPESLAYVMYTSGSTGTPKGVMQTHRNVLHRIVPAAKRPGISSRDRVVLLYPYSSSGSVRDIFGSLMGGATLLPFDVHEHGWTPLARWLTAEEVTVYNSAATLFRHFAGDLEAEDLFPHLRLIQVGSETIYRSDVELYKAHFASDCVFVARLGLSEISPICEYTIGKDTEITGNTVPAGYAAGDPEVLLIDENGREAAPGDVGEIAVRSRFLFSGYWQRLDLTQRALLPDAAGGDRPMFKTGDLGRMRADGCLEHLGRKDFQVKIRGHRVEIEEIESVLSEHPGVLDAGVAVLEEAPGDRRLAACVVPRAPQAPAISHLREFLIERLPAHMVPASFVIVDALPRTWNGKLDRARLPSVAQDQAHSTPSLVTHPPVNAVVASIWESVLGTAPVTSDSDFFELGGDSLAAMQVVSRVSDLLSVNLPLSALFEAPTVTALSAAITKRAADAAGIDQMAEQILQSRRAS